MVVSRNLRTLIYASLTAVFWLLAVVGHNAVARAAPIELTFMHAFIHVNRPLQEQIVQSFNDTHPGIHVTIEPIAWNAAAEKLAIRSAAGVAPDIISLSPTDFQQVVSGGGTPLMDLTTYIEHDLEDPHDIPEPVWNTVRYKGKIYAIPQRISTYLTLYNKSMFSDAGLALLPHDWYDASWNWDAFKTVVKRLSIDKNGDGLFEIHGLQGVSPTEFVPFIFQAGGHFFDEDYTDFTLPDGPGLDAVKLIMDLYRNGFIGGSFLSGTAAIDSGGIPWESADATKAGINWGVGPLPQGPAGPATRIGPIPVAIPSGSKHPEAAWTFLKYYMSTEISRLQSKGGIMIQPRRSVTGNSSNYPSQVDDAVAKVFLQTLEVGQPYRRMHPNAVEMVDIINKTISSIWQSGGSLKTALEEIKPQIEGLLAEK